MLTEASDQRAMQTLFIGNRVAVYEAALAAGCRFSAILAVEGSFLHRRLVADNTPFIALAGKAQMIDEIRRASFDLLLSNGCPYIVPVTALRKEHQRFVNVHPSLLPNLKGMHPVNGALLFNQPLGASCHLMDDGIDTGPVISRVYVDLPPGTSLGLCYQLAFMAEADAFGAAFARNFEPGRDEHRELANGSLYFSRTEQSRQIDFAQPIETILRQVAAFSTPGQFAYFTHDGDRFPVADATRIDSRYVSARFSPYEEFSVVLRYSDALLLKMPEGYLHLSGIATDAALPPAGTRLTGHR